MFSLKIYFNLKVVQSTLVLSYQRKVGKHLPCVHGNIHLNLKLTYQWTGHQCSSIGWWKKSKTGKYCNKIIVDKIKILYLAFQLIK